MRKRVAVLAVVCLWIAAPGAQAPDRFVTTADTLVANPLFFHGKRVVVRHPVRRTDRLVQLDATSKPVYIFWREQPSGSEGEIRGEFWDLGRMQEGDERFSSFDFRAVVEEANKGRWPAREQVFVILNAAFIPVPPPTTPTIRSIVLAPEQFDNRTVTLTGRFKGRNLYGDLPQGVSKSKWDFVLQSADAAVWITGLRPKGKDFDLDPGARVDTGRWVEVTGIVHRDVAALWIAGESIRVATAPTDIPVEAPQPRLIVEPPPSVIFSAPLADDTDFPVSGRVRIQFSRDMNGTTFHGRVRIHYIGPNPPATAPTSTATYDEGTRSLEIKFKDPLPRFQSMSIELQEGIAANDGQVLKPWTLRFSTGG